MDTRRLRILLELSRRGSMRAVADEMDITTSTVSQQIAALAGEVGATLIEPVGRNVRLTPAGRRLADHSVAILAAVDAARLDLDPGAEPAGTVRVSGFATAIRRALLPLIADLHQTHPRVRVSVLEHEPVEQFALLAADDIDLALMYDFTLAPATFDASLVAHPMFTVPWSLGVPADTPDGADLTGRDWIVNSRNPSEQDVVRMIGAVAGFTPRFVHQADSLALLQDLIVAGLGVGLLPADRPPQAGVRLVRLNGPEVLLRAWAVARRGREAWPPLALLLSRLGRGDPSAAS
ncbi:LysR family transcriptional regulator [Actinoplanes sp. NBRC 103695]|uniref:LysR family transcriptional regulator n=1 Tax=Actinoplanes sp. NBRC 103695 TaxID=3032202 RepID=UPI0025532F76|nr:LysR family transcriptional regulator [Actinoplanes sp. NBRC 103695]